MLIELTEDIVELEGQLNHVKATGGALLKTSSVDSQIYFVHAWTPSYSY